MRINKLFLFSLAALSMAACSNDDEIVNGGNPQEGQGAIVDAISISFANSGANTRTDKGEVEGVGTENEVYVAYIFAKENDPQHTGVKVGDWTVKRVAGDTAAATDAAVTTPIGKGDVASPGTKLNMATFNGVRQGDSVYVVVNDPNLSEASANALAHQGDKSQAGIRAYVSNLTKAYLNDLTVKSDAVKAGKKFIMAGAAAIPTNPTTPNGGTVKVPVALDRELAKVSFDALVTTDTKKEACGKIEIKAATNATSYDGDGLVVVRIPRNVCFFTQKARDWYSPLGADAAAKNWDLAQLNVFDGINELTGWQKLPQVDPTAGNFNAAEPAETVKEYRMTWRLKDTSTAADLLVLDKGILTSPYFYVTPNYANHSGCATVIVTQATYTGSGALEPILTDVMLKGAFGNTAVHDEIMKEPEAATKYTSYDKVGSDVWAKATILAKVVDYLNSDTEETNAFHVAITGDKAIAVTPTHISITTGDKRFYRADVANYTADETTSLKVTERNTYYRITGTITTLGAKTIEDAINSDDINMLVQVTVKNWKYKVNNIEM